MAKTPAKPSPLKRGGVQVTNDAGQLGWRLRTWDARANRQPERTFYGTEHEAMTELVRWRDELAESHAPAPAGHHNMRVGTWAVQWLRDYAWEIRPVGQNPGKQRPRGTWKNAKANVTAYIAPPKGGGLGHRTLASLTYDDCYDFVAGLRVDDEKREAAAGTKEKVASVLRIMLKDAKRAGVVRANVAEDLPTSWGGRRKVIIPSLKQVEDLAEELDEQWPGRGDIVRVFAYTGLRWEDLSGLRWAEVDFAKRSLHVWQARPSAGGGLGDPKTLASARYAAIIDQALEPLERLKEFADARESEWVICGERGGPLNYSLWRKHLDKARAKTGVPYTAHGLRHLCVSIMIAGGATSREVADQVGHSRTSVTETVYRHAFAMDRTELAKRLTLAVTNVEVDELAEKAA